MTLLAQSIQTSKYTPVSGNFLSSSYPNNSNPPVDGDGTSDFVIDNSTVFSFDRTAYPLLAKGATAVDVITGATVQRMTAPGDLALTSSSVNGYSRNSQVNCDKTHYFNFSTNSFSSAIHLMSDKSVVIQPAYDGSGINSHSIGMSHEMRWHATDPNIFYYRHNNTLRKFDIRLTNTQNAGDIVKDFDVGPNAINWPSAASGQIQRVYNDQEGNCSSDSDHWAFMAAWYDGSTYRVAAFIHYQISTGLTHIKYPGDDGVAADVGNDRFLSRPNTIEMVPDGSAVLIHSNRAYTGWIEAYDGTYYDGPHIWPNDWNIDTENGGFLPKKVAVGSTHSGWGWDDQGRPLLVSQDNRNDQLSYVVAVLDPAVLGYGSQDTPGAGVTSFADHGYMGYCNFHACSMPSSIPGWIMISTYGGGSNWSANQLLMMKLEPRGANSTTKTWRVSPQAGLFDDYFSEMPASINMDGSAIMTCAKNPSDGVMSMYQIGLPTNWPALLEAA